MKQAKTEITMEKKRYEMPQVEVRELEGEVLMQNGSDTGARITNTTSNPEQVNLSNRDNVWDMW